MLLSPRVPGFKEHKLPLVDVGQEGTIESIIHQAQDCQEGWRPRCVLTGQRVQPRTVGWCVRVAGAHCWASAATAGSFDTWSPGLHQHGWTVLQNERALWSLQFGSSVISLAQSTTAPPSQPCIPATRKAGKVSIQPLQQGQWAVSLPLSKIHKMGNFPK